MTRHNAPGRPAARRRRPNTRRAGTTAALCLLLAALTACAPAASWLRDQLDSGDAILAFHPDGGIIFDPGAAPAYQVHVTVRGEDLSLPPPGHAACTVDETARYLDCSLGTVTGPVPVRIDGRRMIGSATYTREPAGIAWRWAYTPTQ